MRILHKDTAKNDDMAYSRSLLYLCASTNRTCYVKCL